MIKKQMIWNKMALFGVVLTLMMLTAPSALAATSAYIDPSTKDLNCGESTTMEVRIVTEDAITMVAEAHIHFDPTCVNITNVGFEGAAWQPLAPPGWSHQGNHVIAGTANWGGVVPGDHLFATITVECVCSGGDCTSDIWLESLVPNCESIGHGTITCGASTPPPCLGTCYEGTVCDGDSIGEMNCSDCIDLGGHWHPNKDAACFDCYEPFDLCIDWCPECCDGEDNDGDGTIDYSADTNCTCGLDLDEETRNPVGPDPILPELPTLALAGIGILGAILLARKRE